MVRFVLDENFNGKITRGLRLRDAEIDLIRVQDTDIYGADDETVLEWAVKEKRVLLTHDIDTMTKYANERIKKALPMAGVIENIHAETLAFRHRDERETLLSCMCIRLKNA